MKMAAIASYSAQGGFSVSISTTVQPRLLKKRLCHLSANFRLSPPYRCNESKYLSQITLKDKWAKLGADRITNIYCPAVYKYT